ncbi:DegT/DnrJ/EryC1/StrS family aminotransferase [Mesoterricola silvestris]|uniref:CDP-4-keto-6-deoxy-D-glucose-3-dehydrase n=1 Tax=Mesoterricola silvestris TaxID=2927979 RepID=A0AA48K887_9BACT|nr:DegT/DnrJ/EryC1/StrS family aminotransferase [Mesoterricola silvestris]BDU71077.1 CDP-4-keto-6-deoxy-D-glucose-3-dehydrase [Mesoterricola silvestris]
MSFRFPLATTSWGTEEIDAMHRVIDSGMYTMGPNVKACEKAFAQAMGSRSCVMVNSGSSANLLMIAALFYTKDPLLKLKAGDEIIVPAVSWSTTYYPLHQYGLKLKFVDIDLETLNLDHSALERALTDRTRAILAVNLLGNPNDFNKIQQLIAGRDILLLEDNCESMGARFQGRMAGTFGLMGTYSSFFSHHISTMEGGFVVTDNEELDQILRCLRAHGWTRDLPKSNLVCGDKGEDPFEESYRFVLPGYNFRPLEMEGALGIEQIRRLPSIVAERRKNAALFQAKMESHPDLMIQRETGESSWFGFSLVIRPGRALTRKALVKRLNELGFECRPIVAGNFAKNEVVKFFNAEVASPLRNAEHIDQFGLFIGNHHFPIAEAFEQLGRV